MKKLATLVLVLSTVDVHAQRRCRLGEVRQSDGSFRLGGCDELLLFGESIGDVGAEALALALVPHYGVASSAIAFLAMTWPNMGPTSALYLPLSSLLPPSWAATLTTTYLGAPVLSLCSAIHYYVFLWCAPSTKKPQHTIIRNTSKKLTLSALL